MLCTSEFPNSPASPQSTVSLRVSRQFTRASSHLLSASLWASPVYGGVALSPLRLSPASNPNGGACIHFTLMGMRAIVASTTSLTSLLVVRRVAPDEGGGVVVLRRRHNYNQSTASLLVRSGGGVLRRRQPLLVPAHGAQPIDDKNKDDAIAEEEESSIGERPVVMTTQDIGG